jgi:hypothetical protein
MFFDPPAFQDGNVRKNAQMLPIPVHFDFVNDFRLHFRFKQGAISIILNIAIKPMPEYNKQ